jgi:hypothetical protein
VIETPPLFLAENTLFNTKTLNQKSAQYNI